MEPKKEAITKSNLLKSPVFQVPSYMNIRDIFLYDFHLKRDTIDKELQKLSAVMLSIEHTFQIM